MRKKSNTFPLFGARCAKRPNPYTTHYQKWPLCGNLGGRAFSGASRACFLTKIRFMNTREGSTNQAFLRSGAIRATRGAKNLQFLKVDARDLRYIRTARKGEERKAQYIRTFSELDEQKRKYIRTFGLSLSKNANTFSLLSSR